MTEVFNNRVKNPTSDYENELLAVYDRVIGVDEAGRGAIAGPVAVGAQLLTLTEPPTFPTGLRDSKLLIPRRREAVYEELARASTGAVGFTSPAIIDSEGIIAGLAAAAIAALRKLLRKSPAALLNAVILLDGKHDWLTPVITAEFTAAPRVITRVGADSACTVVAAASVRAKVARDRLMCTLAQELPEYLWQNNKGYGSAAHYQAIVDHGVTPQHRVSWIR
ncbi:ribonuclease HII [Canibacter sp. lx-45]|uniref:ribonuclease HII n=1 Tax=Canibacter zhuwentaonis TaxID=2837491 RepID=UPI001BDD6EEA|nr:ribonuclease HII [Canibacter zhuwentaonis]MBT1034916.1 ribonuclease HII [Canibacter zhuwentaonis]